MLEDFSGDEEVGRGVVLDELGVVVLFVPGALECEGEVEVELEVVVDEDDELEDEEEDDEDEEVEEDEDEDEELDELGETVVVVVVTVVVVDDDPVVGVVHVIVSETVPAIPRVGMTPGVASIGSVF